MADNKNATAGDGSIKIATDEVTYSGDAGVNVQLVREVAVTGSEGSKTTIDKAYGAGAANTGTARVIHASDDPLVVAATSTEPVKISQADEYETVAASQPDQVLGSTGAVGDRLQGIIINPATTSPGNVIIKDGATTIYTFTGGASSVPGLGSIVVGLGIVSVSGAFKITTGANVSVIAVGDFS